ncbi:MAG: biopolymer transporter ExbD [Candidatus Zixiibacteriota bacterium]|nr:MAG: biopolymer transporter ExbD [candidate division Zixibacteria bacterium]
MAGTEDNERKNRNETRWGLRRPRRRGRVRIDMTPMVDIAFLLLIFYMVTTVFSRPTLMEIAVPPKEAAREPEPVAEYRLLRLFVDKNDSFYYQIGKGMDQPEKVDVEALSGIIDEKNRNVDDLVMLLKLDQQSSYSSMIQLIDIIQNVEREINAEIALARKINSDFNKDEYSVRFSLENMSAYDEYLLDMANMERR